MEAVILAKRNRVWNMVAKWTPCLWLPCKKIGGALGPGRPGSFAPFLARVTTAHQKGTQGMPEGIGDIPWTPRADKGQASPFLANRSKVSMRIDSVNLDTQ